MDSGHHRTVAGITSGVLVRALVVATHGFLVRVRVRVLEVGSDGVALVPGPMVVVVVVTAVVPVEDSGLDTVEVVGEAVVA